MKTSPEGLLFIAAHEGIVPAPYLDPVNVWTYGIGHAETSGLEPNPRHMPKGNPSDMDAAVRQAFDLFRKHIQTYERAVNAAVTVPLKQHEFDALVSFHFNTGAIRKASATRVLNESGVKSEVVRRLKLYNKGGGKVLPGLVRRRKEEGDLFLTGTYPEAQLAIFSVTALNRVGGVRRRMGAAEAMRLLAPQRPAQPAPAPSTPDPKGKAQWGLIGIIIAAIAAFVATR